MFFKRDLQLTTSVVFTVILLCLSACTDEQTAAKPPKEKSAHLVESVTVNQQRLDIEVTRTGTLRARREVKIHTQEDGQITALPFYEGDRVRQGEVVVRLDDKLLRAQLTRAQATLKQAQQDMDRAQNLFKKKLIPDEELNRAETQLQVAKADEEVLNTRLSYTVIRSPLTGIVSARLSEPGNIAEKHTHLLTISDPTSLITDLTLSELLISKLSLNQAVTVSIDALGSDSFKGEIERIYPDLDPVTRRGTVEVEIKPVPKGARPGQLCRVTIKTESADRLVIPFNALRRDNEGEYVFVVDDKSKAKRTPITTGLRINEAVEVLQGLQAGMNVVSKGFLGLVDNKSVEIVTPGAKKDKAKGKTPDSTTDKQEENGKPKQDKANAT